ncbi:MAG: leucine-rich repeat domain-containing protein [Bacteroidaceae bacterium]|nr:leucine-rich repeat domain-containing protein [Bacteroidaceae bacterium]
MKHIKHWLITVAVLLCSVTASAQSFEVDGIFYNVTSSTDLTAEVVPCVNNKYEGSIVIPSQVSYLNKEYTVTRVGSLAFSQCFNLSSITLPNTVTSIGSQAFYYCKSLTSITIPITVKTIEFRAFGDCSNLTSINIPSGVTRIEQGLFYGCSKLKAVTIPSSVNTIDIYAFRDCSNLSSIVIPKSVTSIGDEAFSGCTSLTSVTSVAATPPTLGFSVFSTEPTAKLYVPKNSNTAYASAGWNSYFSSIAEISGSCGANLTWILCNDGELIVEGTGAMSNYSMDTSPWAIYSESITKATIKEGVTTIGDYAFQGCTALTSASLPTGLTSIGKYAFQWCEALVTINIPTTVVSMGIGAFYYCSLTSLTLPEGIKNIEQSTFTGNEFTSVVIPQGVTVIGVNSFCDCKQLESVTIPNSVQTIGEMAFQYCPKLASVAIPNSVVTIERYAFDRCSSLATLSIGEGVTGIGKQAFSDCSKLESVICKAVTPPAIDAVNTFYNVNKTIPVYVPKSSVVAYKSANYWKEFTNIQSIPKIVSVTDSNTQGDFTQAEDEEFDEISYTRTLPNLHWNPLYVPFEIPMTAEFLEDYDVAYFNDIHSYDEYIGDKENGILGADGEIDRMSMEVLMVQEGATLNANYPYLIRAKNEAAKALNITVTDATLYETVETTISCSSVFMDFEVTGSYSTLTSSYLDEDYRVIISTGSWGILSSTSKLRPFRIYLKMTARGGSPVKVHSSAMKTISIQVGNEDDTTSIEDGQLTFDNSVLGVVYDLQGRQVKNSGKGIYIVNGKKTVFK